MRGRLSPDDAACSVLSRLAAFGSLLNAALLVQPHVAAERHNEELSIASPFQASLLLPAGEQAEPGLFQPRTFASRLPVDRLGSEGRS